MISSFIKEGLFHETKDGSHLTSYIEKLDWSSNRLNLENQGQVYRNQSLQNFYLSPEKEIVPKF